MMIYIYRVFITYLTKLNRLQWITKMVIPCGIIPCACAHSKLIFKIFHLYGCKAIDGGIAGKVCCVSGSGESPNMYVCNCICFGLLFVYRILKWLAPVCWYWLLITMPLSWLSVSRSNVSFSFLSYYSGNVALFSARKLLDKGAKCISLRCVTFVVHHYILLLCVNRCNSC